ncbi:hypothetical protein LINPERPRIM_LOCUS28538 [Linum perenne]
MPTFPSSSYVALCRLFPRPTCRSGYSAFSSVGGHITPSGVDSDLHLINFRLAFSVCFGSSSMAAPVFEFDAAVVAESQSRYSTSLLARCFLPNPKPRQWLQATLGRKWNVHSSGFRSPSQEVFEDLRFASFWVRLEEVPSEFRSLQFGTGLLQPLGQVMYSGLYDSVAEGKEFIRAFVRIDVTQPLLGRRKARYSNGGEFWVNFGYKGLPTVCFGCGLLGHPLRLCPSPFADGTNSEDRGSWMQVEKTSYHQVKSAGKKRSAADYGGSGEGSSLAAGEAASSKQQRIDVGPKGLALVQAQPDKSQALGVDSHVYEGPTAASFGFGQPVSAHSADLDMVDAISESVDFLLDQPALPEVPPLHLSLLSELSNLYITNPSGSFDNGLPIDVQVGQIASTLGAITHDYIHREGGGSSGSDLATRGGEKARLGSSDSGSETEEREVAVLGSSSSGSATGERKIAVLCR